VWRPPRAPRQASFLPSESTCVAYSPLKLYGLIRAFFLTLILSFLPTVPYNIRGFNPPYSVAFLSRRDFILFYNLFFFCSTILRTSASLRFLPPLWEVFSPPPNLVFRWIVFPRLGERRSLSYILSLRLSGKFCSPPGESGFALVLIATCPSSLTSFSVGTMLY